MNEFGGANIFNVTIDKVTDSNLEIQKGIDTSVISGATVYDSQLVYIRDLNNNQVMGRVDKFAVSGTQRWALNYKSLEESFIGLFNLTTSFYALEMEKITNATIRYTVSKFINDTKV